jgi:hypothetical protein
MMDKRIKLLALQAGLNFDGYGVYVPTSLALQETVNLQKFAELVWKAAYEEGHDVGVDAGFEAGRNASFTERNFGVE